MTLAQMVGVDPRLRQQSAGVGTGNVVKDQFKKVGEETSIKEFVGINANIDDKN